MGTVDKHPLSSSSAPSSTAAVADAVAVGLATDSICRAFIDSSCDKAEDRDSRESALRIWRSRHKRMVCSVQSVCPQCPLRIGIEDRPQMISSLKWFKFAIFSAIGFSFRNDIRLHPLHAPIETLLVLSPMFSRFAARGSTSCSIQGHSFCGRLSGRCGARNCKENTVSVCGIGKGQCQYSECHHGRRRLTAKALSKEMAVQTPSTRRQRRRQSDLAQPDIEMWSRSRSRSRLKWKRRRRPRLTVPHCVVC